MFALDYIQPKLSFLFFGNAMKKLQTLHPSSSTPQNNTVIVYSYFVLFYSVNMTKIATNLTVLPTSRRRRACVSACDITVKHPIANNDVISILVNSALMTETAILKTSFYITVVLRSDYVNLLNLKEVQIIIVNDF